MEDKELVAYFDAALVAGAPAKQAANWLTGDIMAWLKARKDATVSTMPLSAVALAEFTAMIEDGVISGKIGRISSDLLTGADGKTPGEIVEERGLKQISDPAEIEAIVDKVLAANPGQLEQFRGGKEKLKGFFVGAVLRESGGGPTRPCPTKSSCASSGGVMTSEGRRSGRNSVASRSRVKRCATEDSSERASPFAAAGAFHARDEIPMKCHAAPFEIICVRAESDDEGFSRIEEK